MGLVLDLISPREIEENRTKTQKQQELKANQFDKKKLLIKWKDKRGAPNGVLSHKGRRLDDIIIIDQKYHLISFIKVAL